MAPYSSTTEALIRQGQECTIASKAEDMHRMISIVSALVVGDTFLVLVLVVFRITIVIVVVVIVGIIVVGVAIFIVCGSGSVIYISSTIIV